METKNGLKYCSSKNALSSKGLTATEKIQWTNSKKWKMQKLGIHERLRCKNAAWHYFPLTSRLNIQEMKDAEILHLFPSKFTSHTTTNERCRNSASLNAKNSARPYFPLNSQLTLEQMNDAEVLHPSKTRARTLNSDRARILKSNSSLI